MSARRHSAWARLPGLEERTCLLVRRLTAACDPRCVRLGQRGPQCGPVQVHAVRGSAGLLSQDSASEPASRPSKPSSPSRRSTTCLAAGSSPATERQTRPGAPSGVPRESKLAARMLLNALTTGRPSNCATHSLSVSPRRSRRYARRAPGNSCRYPRRRPLIRQRGRTAVPVRPSAG